MKPIYAVIFCCFTFCFVYFFQADIIAVAQHALSKGQTSFNPIVGAILITVILFVVQRFVIRFVKLQNRVYVLSYIPSFLILMFIADISDCAANNETCWHLLFSIPLSLALMVFVFKVALKLPKYDRHINTVSLLTRTSWTNLLILLILSLLTLMVSNTDKVEHEQATLQNKQIKAHKAYVAKIKLKAEQDSLRQIFVHDSIIAAKDSIRRERLRLDSLERIKSNRF